MTTTPPAYPCPGTPHATTTCTPCRQCYHGAPCSPSWAFYFYFLGSHLDQQYHLSPAGPGNLIYNLYSLLWASSTMVAKLAGFLSCFFFSGWLHLALRIELASFWLYRTQGGWGWYTGGFVHNLNPAPNLTHSSLRCENFVRNIRDNMELLELPGGGTHQPSSETQHSGQAQVDEVEDDLISFRDPGHRAGPGGLD